MYRTSHVTIAVTTAKNGHTYIVLKQDYGYTYIMFTFLNDCNMHVHHWLASLLGVLYTVYEMRLTICVTWRQFYVSLIGKACYSGKNPMSYSYASEQQCFSAHNSHIIQVHSVMFISTDFVIYLCIFVGWITLVFPYLNLG